MRSVQPNTLVNRHLQRQQCACNPKFFKTGNQVKEYDSNLI